MAQRPRVAELLAKGWPFLLVAAVGIFLRVHSFETLSGVGFDEKIYADYVGDVAGGGLVRYPDIVRQYLKTQAAYPIALLPPTRVTFIAAAAALKMLTGTSSVESLRTVSCGAAIITLLLGGIVAFRMRGAPFALAVLVLLAVAPTQIYMAHRALIDGFFGCIALATLAALWEALRAPVARLFWPILYGLGVFLLVLTKENALFVFLALVALLVANRWLKFGQVARATVLATIVAPLSGVAALALISGGFEPLTQVFSLNAAKTMDTPYAIATGDGPWFRYLSDLLLVSPAVTLFAIGGAFRLRREDQAGAFLLAFLVFSYLPMCNVTYGMNLRYANMWDFPLRYLAASAVFIQSGAEATQPRRWLTIGLVALLALFEFANYLRVFVVGEVYDPTPSALMKALEMIKPLPSP
jgi:4-amino-4-deoxy-L-arabinose transferase-like glycosyltransferase